VGGGVAEAYGHTLGYRRARTLLRLAAALSSPAGVPVLSASVREWIDGCHVCSHNACSATKKPKARMPVIA
jgi:hypothetical protein